MDGLEEIIHEVISEAPQQGEEPQSDIHVEENSYRIGDREFEDVTANHMAVLRYLILHIGSPVSVQQLKEEMAIATSNANVQETIKTILSRVQRFSTTLCGKVTSYQPREYALFPHQGEGDEHLFGIPPTERGDIQYVDGTYRIGWKRVYVDSKRGVTLRYLLENPGQTFPLDYISDDVAKTHSAHGARQILNELGRALEKHSKKLRLITENKDGSLYYGIAEISPDV